MDLSEKGERGDVEAVSEVKDGADATVSGLVMTAPQDKQDVDNEATTPTQDDEIPHEMSINSRIHSSLTDLNPSVFEKLRDSMLRWLDGAFFQSVGLVVLFFVITDGAFFFFLLLGWQGMCDYPLRTNCEPRNWWYNFAVQFLTALFTYMVTISMPWRCANFVHTIGWSHRYRPYRPNKPGLDLYGMPSKDIWFHVPLVRRAGIEVMLLLNCFTQYANQICRGIFRTYEKQNEFPGVFWVNIFFGSSFLFAAIGAVWQIAEERNLRRQFPGKFQPGPVEWINKHWTHFCVKKKDEEQEEDEEEDTHGEQEPQQEEYDDPTRNELHQVVVPCFSRANARLWGL